MAAAGGRGARGKKSRAPRARAGRTPARRTPPSVPPFSAPRGSRSDTRDVALPAGPFRLGATPGATPGKWIDTWKERMPLIPLDLVVLDPADQRSPLFDVEGSSRVDAAIVRQPIDPAGLHVIPLYDEVPVVVCAADSHLTAADELTLDDLAGEVVIVPHTPPLELSVPGALSPRFAAPADVADAIALVATGVGVVVVPMSLARLHHRRDVAHRPLRGAPVSPVALVWRSAGETPPLVDAFIGIVRGRTARSSR